MTRGNVLAALVVSALVGCSDPKAGTLPSASPTTTFSTSATPSTTRTADPTDLRRVAAEYYEAVQRTAANPSDHASLERLIDRACECRDVIDLLRRLDRERHRLEFEITLSGARVSSQTASKGTVFVNVAQSAGREVDATGATVRSIPATKGTYAVDLIHVADEWLVRRITRTS